MTRKNPVVTAYSRQISVRIPHRLNEALPDDMSTTEYIIHAVEQQLIHDGRLKDELVR